MNRDRATDLVQRAARPSVLAIAAFALGACAGSLEPGPTTPAPTSPGPRADASDQPPATTATPRPPEGPVERAASAIRALQRTLASYAFDQSPAIPEPAQAPLAALSPAVREYLLTVLRERVRTSETDHAVISEAILAPLDAVGALGCAQCESAGPAPRPAFGDLEVTGVERPPEAPDWLAVTTGTSLGCAWDGALYVFRAREGQWELAMADEAGARRSVSDGRGSYGLAIMGAGEPSGPYVLARSTETTCSPAAGATLRYRALQIGDAPPAPTALLERTHTVSGAGGRDPAGEMVFERDGFRVNFVRLEVRGARRTVCDASARYRVRAGRIEPVGAVTVQLRTCRAEPR